MLGRMTPSVQIQLNTRLFFIIELGIYAFGRGKRVSGMDVCYTD